MKNSTLPLQENSPQQSKKKKKKTILPKDLPLSQKAGFKAPPQTLKCNLYYERTQSQRSKKSIPQGGNKHTVSK